MPAREPLARNIDRLRSEIVKLAALIAITAAAFAGTRALVARIAETDLRDAAAWHRRGQQALLSGDMASAADAFRRAVAKDRNNSPYGLALADALAMGHQSAAAERVLLSLRRTAPEDPAVNLSLARLAAGRGDVLTALRYYQSALYAPQQTDESLRRIRLELIEFLLRNGEKDRAVSELIAASNDVGGEPGALVHVANLLLQAGEAGRAMEDFQDALRLDASHPDAAAGAGTAAFRLGDFASAARYLRSAPARPELVDMRTTAELVLSRDPLAARLRAPERRRRLATNIAHVRVRLEQCTPAPPPPPEPGFSALQETLGAIETRLKRAATDQDVVDDGIAAVHSAERFLESRCGPLTPLDRALVIIAERRGGTQG